MTENPAITSQHQQKVYGRGLPSARRRCPFRTLMPALLMANVVLFGPFATFSTKFLKNGSFFDLLSTTTTSNFMPMTHVGLDNFDLVKYTVSQSC